MLGSRRQLMERLVGSSDAYCGRGSKGKRTRRGPLQSGAFVESPGGISPPGAPRTVHDPLESHGSRCSAIASNGFASSTGSSRFQLASVRDRTTQPLRSSHITEPSTLLRAAPPLCPASVLSPSRLEPLAACPFTSSDVTRHRFSRSVRKPGRASRRLHAGCRSGSIRASPELIPEEGSPPGSDIA